MMNADDRQRPDFQILLEQYGPELHAHLWRMLGDQQDAEDCLQETYLRAYDAYERTKADSNYRAWLYTIATNRARTMLKKSNRHKPTDLHELPAESQDPLARLSQVEQLRRVKREMERLSFRQRTAILMRKYSELDYELIAEALECSPDTARAHVYQGLKRLRKRLTVEES
jgi:RNA polymerase sigma-70 factor (ECF subfamily)